MKYLFRVRLCRQISFQFRTRLPHGLLVYHNVQGPPDGVELEPYALYVIVQQGQLKVVHVYGKHSTALRVGRGLNRDQWHSVTVRTHPYLLQSNQVRGYIFLLQKTCTRKKIIYHIQACCLVCRATASYCHFQNSTLYKLHKINKVARKTIGNSDYLNRTSNNWSTWFKIAYK